MPTWIGNVTTEISINSGNMNLSIANLSVANDADYCIHTKGNILF